MTSTTTDDPTFRDLLDVYARTRQHCQSLLDLVRKEHYDQHTGSIHACRAATCRLVVRRRRIKPGL